MLTVESCPCHNQEIDDWRKPASFGELRAAVRDGVPVHDEDGDHLRNVWTTEEVKADQAALNRMYEHSFNGPWDEEAIGYEVFNHSELYFRKLDFFLLPTAYNELPPVTPEEEAEVIRSILGSGA